MTLKTVKLHPKDLDIIKHLIGGPLDDYLDKLIEQFDAMRNITGTIIAKVLHGTKGKLDDEDTAIVRELIQLFYRTSGMKELFVHLRNDDGDIKTSLDPTEEKMSTMIADISSFTASLDEAETAFNQKMRAAADALKANRKEDKADG